MKDFTILKFLDIFKGLFNASGVDYCIMRRILQVKLTMDGRRVPTIIGNQRRNNAKDEYYDRNNFLRSLWMYALFGLILIPFVAIGKNYMFQMSLTFGMIMFLVLTTLISDFSAVLLDIRDKDIICTKPVSSKTINMAKTIHILIYMFFITASLTGPALVISLFTQGILFFVIFLCEIILADMLIVALTALLYLLILRFFDGEKLKDIINYIQIILSIAVAVGYQFIGRLFEFTNINAVFTPKWWQYLVMPVWFGGPFEVLVSRNYSISFAAFSVLAAAGPVIAIILYIKLMPSFERNLQKLSNNVSKAQKENKMQNKVLPKLFCRSREERTFFRFSSQMMKNEREFKLRVYPSLGFAIIFPFIFIINELRIESFSSVASGRAYLNIYFCALMLPTIIMMIKYSGKYKAAWIYRVMPIENSPAIFKGTLKAFIAKLLLPVYLVESIIFTFIFGVRIIPDLIAVFLTMMLFIVICFRVLKAEYPFSLSFEGMQQSQGIIVLPLMLLLGVFVIVHFALSFISYGVIIYLVAMLVINIFAWKFGLNV